VNKVFVFLNSSIKPYEYHVVHGDMTKKVAEFDPNLKHYTQVANLEFENREEDQPS
jgi:hypothetical protein